MPEQNQNRILPQGWNKEGSDPVKTVKIISLAVLTTLLSVINWWLINLALNGTQSLEFWIWPILVTLLWITFLAFFSLVNRNQALYALINLVSLLAYLFIMPNDLFVVLGGLLFVALSLWFQKRIKVEEKGQLHFSVFKILNSSIGIMIYALLIVLGFNIYISTNQDFKNNPDVYYDRIGASAVKSLKLSGSLTTSNKIDLDQTFDDFLLTSVSSQQSFGQFDLSGTREQILQNLNVQALGSESLAEILSKAITDQVKDLLAKYDKFFPLIFTLIIIALLRMFAFVFKWICLLITWFFYKVLLSFGFFRLAKIPVEIEQLEI
ncbi:MAG: hypothetical protein Q8P83_02835 [bacterium]|nr:hypothetical protein [bacterium]